VAGNPAPAAPSNPHGESIDLADDAILVARVRSGDGTAYAVLVDRYGHRLHAMLLHLAAGDAELAGEFTQEAFVRAFANLDQFAGRSGFYTWLWRLARNRAIDLLARKRPQATDLSTLQPSSNAAAPGARLEQDELRAGVQRALARLPIDSREIIVLREFDQLDYAEIADVLDLAEGTVKSRLNRARAALRELLAAEGLP